MSRVGELGVKVAELSIDLEDTTGDLAESMKFLAEWEVNCELTELAEYGNMMRQECSLWQILFAGPVFMLTFDCNNKSVIITRV